MTLFGIITIALGVTRAMPQLVRLLRTRRAYGVSVDTAATSMIVSSGWTVYGVLTGQLSISFASGASATIFAMIMLAALRFGRRLRELKIAPLWLAVLVLFGGVGGAAGLSIVLPVSVLAANVPQVWVAYRERNLADLSLGMWLLALTDAVVWGSYGIVQNDLSVLVNNAFLLLTSAMIVGLKLASMARHARQPDAPLPVAGEG